MSDDKPGINDDPMAAERQDKLDEFVRRGQAAQKAADELGIGRPAPLNIVDDRDPITRERESKSPYQWTCGHTAGAMCAQCYTNLAARANALAEENARLRPLNEMLIDLERHRLNGVAAFLDQMAERMDDCPFDIRDCAADCRNKAEQLRAWSKADAEPHIPDTAVTEALNKMIVDLQYRTPELGKPLGQIVLRREAAEAIVAWAATRWPR